MSTEQMRGLDLWIAEHVMGWSVKFTDRKVQLCYEAGKVAFINFKPTTDPAAAMLVLERCEQEAEHKSGSITMWKALGLFCMCLESFVPSENEVVSLYHASAPTRHLAICLFARQLFTK